MGISIVPPPTWRHAPTRAGRQVIAEIASPPPGCARSATPWRMRRAGWWRTPWPGADVRPGCVISETRSGGKFGPAREFVVADGVVLT